MKALRLGHLWPAARSSFFGILFVFTIFLLYGTGMAAASWSPSVTVSESGTRYGFGQDVGPDGTGLVVWSSPLTGGAGYSISAREVGVDGELGTKLALSEAAPGAAYTSAYAPTVRYDATGTATVVWLESTYSSGSCFAESGEEGEECVVDEYVRARQIEPGGSLSPLRELQHRQTVLPDEGSFGGTSSAYVTYGQPVLTGGPTSALTVLWSESTFDSGCAAYGYSHSYVDSECEADQQVKWLRLSAAGMPQGSPQSAFESHTSGYGSGEPLLRLRAGAAADGTVTVLFRARRSSGEGECWGGESAIGFFRIEPGGEAGESEELDSGCGIADPDLAVDPGGAAIAVWGWRGTYSGDEALYSRIDAAGNASAPLTLLTSEEGANVSGLDVARGAPGSALAIWAEEGSIRSRPISFAGSLGSTALVAAAPSDRYFSAPRLATAPDGSAVVVWESTTEGGGFETALQATALDADGTPHSPRTLLAPNRRDHGARVSAGPSGSVLTSWRIAVPQRNRIQSARFGVEPAESNDAFADAQPLEAELPSFAAGANFDATKEAEEPNHAGDPGGASVWFAWTPAESGPVTLATCASEELNPTLGVYTGSSLATLAPVAAAAGGAPRRCSAGDAGVRFDAVAGTTYRIAVDGQAASEGTFGLKLISRTDPPGNDAFAAARQVSGGLPRYLSGSNTDASREAGEPEHAGDPGGASVWYSWTAPTGGKTRISTCGWSLSEPLLGIYTGSTLDSLTKVGSDATGSCSSVSFEAVAGTTYRIAVDGKDGREGRFQLRFAQAPANDDLAKALPLTGPPVYVSGSTLVASKETGEPNHAGDPGGASVWYSWTPSTSGMAFLSACMNAGKDQSALLAVYTGSDPEHLTEVAADAGGGSTSGCYSRHSETTFSFQAGTRYLIALDGPGGVESTFSISLQVAPPNDDFAAAQPIVGSIPRDVYGSNRHATKEAEEPNHAGDPGGASVWYSWTPNTSGIGVLSACGQFGGKPPLLAVYSGESLGALSEVAADTGGGNSCYSGSSDVEFNAVAGETYYIAIDDSAGVGLWGFRLEVDIELAPSNDEFAAAVQIPSDSGGFYGWNRHATKEFGEPNHAGDPGGASVWFKWTPSHDGLYAMSTCSNSSLDPLLAVYTGSALGSLESVASDDDGGNCSEVDAEVRFVATAGITYRIAIDGKAARTGYFEVDIATAPENDDLAAATELIGEAPMFVGGSNWLATREVEEPNHAGDPGGTSVWYSWTPSESSTVQLSVCSYGNLDPLLAVYTGSSPAGLSPVAIEDAGEDPECFDPSTRLKLDAQAGTTYRIAVDGRAGSYGDFSLELRTPPANDDFAAAEPLGPGLPLAVYGNTQLATAQANEPTHAGVGATASVWYSWTAAVSGTVHLSTCSYGPLDPLLAVYTGSSLETLKAVAADDDEGGTECSAGDAKVGFEASAGTTYWIAVDAKDDEGDWFELHLRATGPANDDFADAIQIEPEPGIHTGTTVGAGSQAGEPSNPHQSVWYRMQADHNGTVRLHTCSDDGEPMDLDVFTGSSLGMLNQVAVKPAGTAAACDIEPGYSLYPDTPSLAFDAVAGTVYWISVDRYQQVSPVFELKPPGAFALVVNAPANDLRAAAERLPYSGASLTRSNVGATHEPEEGEHAGEPGGGSVWFRWFASATGPAQIETCGSEIDTLLAAYGPGEPLDPEDEGSAEEQYGEGSAEEQYGEGSAGEQYGEEPPSLPPAPGAVVFSDDSDLCGEGSTQSSLELAAQEGVEYLIAVDGKEGETGQVQLDLAFDAPDTTPPETQVYVPLATNTHQLTFSLTRDEPESSFECALDGADFTPCSIGGSAWYPSGTVTGLEEGPHALEVREVDPAGNPDPTPESREFKVDMVPPQTSFSSGPEGLTNQLGPFGLEADEPASYFECALDDAPLHPCFAPYYLPESLSDGPHTLKVIAIDLAGNRDLSPASRSFDLDRTPPLAVIDSGPEEMVEVDEVEFEFSANEEAAFVCELGEKVTAKCESPRAYADLTDGEHRFNLIPTDTAGNVGEPLEWVFRVEARPPETQIESAPAPRVVSTSAVFAFGGDEELSGFECALDGASFEECDAEPELTDLAEGSHTLQVRAVDLAGKQDPTPAEHVWVIDTKAPETAIDSGPSGLTRFRGPFKFSADEGVSRFECAVDEGEEFVTCFSGYYLPPLADGEHTLQVRAVDLAGNVDPTPAGASLELDTTAPKVTITSAPPELTQSDVTIEWEVDDPEASTRCWVDEGPDFGCASPFQIKGIEDGTHRVAVMATDLAGNYAVAKTPEFTVDEQPPDTVITDAPWFTAGPALIFFAGTADATEYRCSLDDEPFSECSAPLELDDLSEGEHRVRVYSIDTVGNVDPTPDEATFVFDTVPPDTTITETPDGPVHDPVVPFGFESSEEGGHFECSMDGSKFVSCATIAHDRRLGPHLFEVRARDRAGNFDPTPASHPFTVVNQAPVPALLLDRTNGPGPLQVTAAIGAADGDDDELDYEIQFGDGVSSKGFLPHADLSHIYAEPGVYVVRFKVDDGFEEAVAIETVTVGPLEPLSARAGDDRTTVVGEPIRLDGGNSRPLHGIDSYTWSFGDGGSGSGEAVDHTYEQPGTYEAQLTVSRQGEKATDSATITVLPPAPGTAKVAVLGNGSPLAGADVIVMPASGSRVQTVTDGSGVARLHGLADGTYTVAAYKPGYRPEHGVLTVANGAGASQVELQVGEVATATVDSHPMTLDEIEAAGIDPNDPDNQHVYEFEVHLAINPPWGPSAFHNFRGRVNRAGFVSPSCHRVSFATCRIGTGGGYIYLTSHWSDDLGAPLLSALVIPFRATFLKEFYDVSLIVTNLAPAGFDLRNGSASIEVPGGMSLAPTAKPQSLLVDVPDVPGGGSSTVNWILRGDKEGEYDIAAHYGATLEPFGRSINIDAYTDEPIKVWGASALKLEVDVDDVVLGGYPYKVFIKLKNVADVPVYNPSVELLKEGRVGYIEQPRQRREYAIRELVPGAVHTAGPFVLVPEPTGKVNLSRSFIRKTAGDVQLEGTIVTHPRSPKVSETPEVEARGYGDKLVLDWEPVAAAGGYQIFRTLNRQEDFPADPLAAKQLDPTRAVIYNVDPDEPAFYGISSLLDPQEMVHPLATAAGETNREWPKLSIDPGNRCNSRDTAVNLDFEALDFELASYTMTLNDLPFGSSQPLSGYSDSATAHVPFAVNSEGTDLEVVVRDVEGTETSRQINLACDYVALGDSFSSGEGVPTDGSGAPGDGGKFLGESDLVPYDSDQNGCHRSRVAYSRLVMANADSAATGDRLVFAACSGAVLKDMRESGKEPRQLGYLNEATNLVTLSIGGNDMHFAEIIEACVKNQITLDPTCRNDHSTDFLDGYNKVKNELPKLLREIRQRVPRARILVVAYPQLFPSFPYDPLDLFQGGFIGSGLVFSCHTFLVDNINPWDIVWLSGMQQMATQMIEEAVSSSGSGAEYVSMGNRFDGHDVCQEFDPWFNGPFLPPDIAYSFHPNAQGQQAMADAVLQKLGQPRPETFFQIHPGEFVDRTVNVFGGGTGRAAKAIFSQFWPGSDVELTLESPSGRVIGRASDEEDVHHEVGPTFETYVIENPEEGEWTMHFKGLEVAAEGEKVTYEVATTTEENLPPIAQFNQSLDDARPGQQVNFDASGSSDGDGEVEDYEWNFDDGSSGSGQSVKHSFSVPGIYEVRLLVHDDDGAVGVFAQETIWVRPDPIAVADQYALDQGDVLTVGAATGLLANDSVSRVGGDPQAEIVTAPSHGSLALAADGSFEYQPSSSFSGTDTATYRVRDAGGFNSAPATLKLVVQAPPDPGPTDSGSPSPPPAPPAPSVQPAPPSASVQPLKCKKGFKKKKVRGKVKCVKAKKKKRKAKST